MNKHTIVADLMDKHTNVADLMDKITICCGFDRQKYYMYQI